MDEESQDSSSEEKEKKKKPKKNFYGNYEKINTSNFTPEMKELLKLGFDAQEVENYVRKKKMGKEEIIENFLFVSKIISKILKKKGTFER